MRRNVLFIAVLMMVSLACESVQAKSRRHEMRYGHPGDRREMMVDARRPAHYPAYGRPHSRPHVSHHMPPRVDCHGYLPGWHGRVRCVNGRWGYLRGRDWYWYDVYYEPAFYFSHPVAHFHGHLSPAGKVAAGVAGAAAVGALIGALCR